MSFITTITFSQPINASVQIGDNLYQSTPSSSGGFSVVASSSGVTHIGVVYSIIDQYSLELESTYEDQNGMPIPANYPSQGSYISFSKDGQVNQNELLGYYSSFTFVNNSKTKAKLFSVSTEITENSK